MKITRTLRMIAAVIVLIGIVTSCKNKASDDSTNNSEPQITEAADDIFSPVQHMGINYGPYHNTGQAPGTVIPVSQITADLQLLAQNFKFIRTYTVQDGMDQVIAVAATVSMEVAVGIYCTPGNAAKTKLDIDLAVAEAKKHPGTVKAFVVGNETNLAGGNTNYVPDNEVAALMDYAKQKVTEAALTDVSITSCITGTGGMPNGMGDSHACPQILQKCVDLNDATNRVIFMTIYPYYGQKDNQVNTPGEIAGNMTWSYSNGMSQAEGYGLSVVIGEIGWPSKGDDPNMETPENQGINFSATLNWINGTNELRKAFNTFWFEGFDEPWKTSEPHSVGPNWGIYPANGITTPKFTIPKL